MKNIINIIKYNLKKNMIMDIVGLAIYVGLAVFLVKFLGSFMGGLINVVILILALIITPIFSFFQSTSRVSKENALLFSTPVKSHEYILAKLFEYFIKTLPVFLIFVFQGLYTKGIYGELWLLIEEPILSLMTVIYFLTAMGFIMVFLVFIWMKKYIKRYWLTIISALVVSGVIGGITDSILQIIYRFMSYYYIDISGFKMGILDIIVILSTLIAYFILAKKSLDRGIDFN